LWPAREQMRSSERRANRFRFGNCENDIGPYRRSSVAYSQQIGLQRQSKGKLIMDRRIVPAKNIAGGFRLPGDKSISHRYAILSAIAEGETVIRNYAPGADCASTLRCLEALGVAISRRQ